MAFGGERRARAKAWTAEIDAARRRAGLLLPAPLLDALRRLSASVEQWAAAEAAPGRLAPWLPVAFGFGIVLYFTADHEPALWAALAAAMTFTAVAYVSRRRPFGFPLALGVAALAAGFATATFRTTHVAHPVLRYPASSVSLSGFVEKREERERSDRIVLRVSHVEGRRLDTAPERVRLAVKKGTAPLVGSFVEMKARLTPPLPPLRPGGYDFARDMYFQQIGASGYALGAIRPATAPQPPTLWLRYAAFLDNLRETIDRRIRAAIPGDEGAIASALITGKRDAISQPVNDAMYVSSLAHVLSISGFHMAVVAGIVFFFLRAGLALVPSLAVRHPIKKWSAAAAFAAALFYLLLSGNEVATQRSFIMIGIVLIGVMLDRPALTFRTIAVAALGVLLFAPEAVVHPSFQMSFAATLALIAAYQYGLPFHGSKDTPLAARLALWGVREIVGLILASLVAGLATTPYAAYHFHRLAPYGVIANLLAMPVVSGFVMPMGILGVLAMPFGFDAPFWHLMGAGIDWMDNVALWVASLPGAVGHIHAFGTGPLLLGTAGMLLICLLRTPLRWSGAVLAALACAWVLAVPRPDVLVAADGQTAAFRGADGHLALLRSGRDTFAIKEWLAADADARTAKDKSLSEGVRCDADGCIGRLANGKLVSIALSAEAFAEDCARAVVVISPREAPSACGARLIDRNVWRANGAMSLRLTGNGFAQSAARPPGYERPWAQGPRVMPQVTPATATPRDATPKAEDMEAGD
ncbi:MAG TPA: ComEC/Rec2 family competence protein [Pseudolabrys sp.]|nr:ComEC/Rec2 family competence protein [Pseudolabrys sp.]